MPLLQKQTETACPGPAGSTNNNLWSDVLQLYFQDALQGTASKYPNADETISKAYDIAKHSFLVVRQAYKGFELEELPRCRSRWRRIAKWSTGRCRGLQTMSCVEPMATSSTRARTG